MENLHSMLIHVIQLRGILKSDCEAIFTYNNIPRELIEDDCMYFEVKK